MSADIVAIAGRIVSAKRKYWLRHVPIFESYARVSSAQLDEVERRIDLALPGYLREWLLEVGYGDIDRVIAFREEWFTPVETGQLKGGAIFAQDILGNHYAFDVAGRIYLVSRSEPTFALISDTLLEFLGELARRDYKLLEWMDQLETDNYDW